MRNLHRRLQNWIRGAASNIELFPMRHLDALRGCESWLIRRSDSEAIWFDWKCVGDDLNYVIIAHPDDLGVHVNVVHHPDDEIVVYRILDPPWTGRTGQDYLPRPFSASELSSDSETPRSVGRI